MESRQDAEDGQKFQPDGIPTERIRAALVNTKGMVYLAARQIPCDPSVIYRRMDREPSLLALKKALKGEMVDTAEVSLYTAVIAGHGWAVKYMLATQGKDRGYEDRSDKDDPDRHDKPEAAITDDDLDARIADVEKRIAEAAKGTPPAAGSG
jgi:hypothetical protein